MVKFARIKFAAVLPGLKFIRAEFKLKVAVFSLVSLRTKFKIEFDPEFAVFARAEFNVKSVVVFPPLKFDLNPKTSKHSSARQKTS